jgi:CRP-like cAMP-binding protein
LTDEQIEALAADGQKGRTETREVLFRQGDLSCDFVVILAGTVAMVEGYGGDEQVISVHSPGQLLGELSLFTGRRCSLPRSCRNPGRCWCLEVERLRRLLAQDFDPGGHNPAGLFATTVSVGRVRRRDQDRRFPLHGGCPNLRSAIACRTSSTSKRTK